MFFHRDEELLATLQLARLTSCFTTSSLSAFLFVCDVQTNSNEPQLQKVTQKQRQQTHQQMFLSALTLINKHALGLIDSQALCDENSSTS